MMNLSRLGLLGFAVYKKGKEVIEEKIKAEISEGYKQ